jgi:hypothetical protein
MALTTAGELLVQYRSGYSGLWRAEESLVQRRDEQTSAFHPVNKNLKN